MQSDKGTNQRLASRLNPLLFNVFIDNIVSYLPETDRYKILLYADDISLFNYGKESLQELLKHLQRHALDNDYKFNREKCYYPVQ